MANNTGAFAGLGGMGAGAGLGALLYAANPVLGALAGAGLGSMAGGLFGSIFGGGEVERPDISGELAKISAMFAEARAASRKAITEESRAGRSQAVSNLASRGTYRSPVAQNVFNAIEQARLQAIGKSEGALAGQEAQTRASLLSQLMGYDVQAQQAGLQRQAGIASGLTSLGSTLLMSALMNRAGTAQTQQGGDFNLNVQGMPNSVAPFTMGGSKYLYPQPLQYPTMPVSPQTFYKSIF